MSATGDPLDVAAIKKDFPILEREVHGGRLVYLDSADTSQKPRAVLDAMQGYYEHSNANVHRGTYLIAEEATAALEGARAKVGRFIGAHSTREVLFTKNATEALNLVAKAWGRANLRRGRRWSCSPRWSTTPTSSRGTSWPPSGASSCAGSRSPPTVTSTSTDLDRLLDGAKLVSFTAMSNVLGTINADRAPRRRSARRRAPWPLVDASQHVPHLPTDVAASGADFVAFTGHKMCGPTGIGVLWGRAGAARRHARRSSAAAR